MDRSEQSVPPFIQAYLNALHVKATAISPPCIQSRPRIRIDRRSSDAPFWNGKLSRLLGFFQRLPNFGAENILRALRFLILILLVIACDDAQASERICGDIGESRPLSLKVRVGGEDVDKQFYKGSYALILSASNYEKWRTLDAVAEEADELATVLASQGFLVRVICDPRSNGDSGFAQIDRFVQEFSDDGNRLIIFLSGHGWVDEKSRKGYFAAVDSPLPGPEATEKGLSSAQLIRILRSSKSRHTLVVVDACYSAAIFSTKSHSSRSIIDFEDIQSRTRQFLTAGSINEKTPSPSVFTPAFLLGISGYADLSKDGIVQASELSTWIRDKVANSTGRQTTPRFGNIPDKPNELVISDGDMIFQFDHTKMDAVRSNLKSEGAKYIQLGAEPISIAATAWPDSRYIVTYYRKSGDENLSNDVVRNIVIDALDVAGVPYVSTQTILPKSEKSNGLACHPNAPADVVKAAARALIEKGVEIKIIDQATVKLSDVRHRLQVLHFKRMDNERYRNITLADLEKIDGCPNEFKFELGQ